MEVEDIADEYINYAYSHKMWGSRMAFRFRMVKILDYRKRLKELAESDSLFVSV